MIDKRITWAIGQRNISMKFHKFIHHIEIPIHFLNTVFGGPTDKDLFIRKMHFRTWKRESRFLIYIKDKRILGTTQKLFYEHLLSIILLKSSGNKNRPLYSLTRLIPWQVPGECLYFSFIVMVYEKSLEFSLATPSIKKNGTSSVWWHRLFCLFFLCSIK